MSLAVRRNAMRRECSTCRGNLLHSSKITLSLRFFLARVPAVCSSEQHPVNRASEPRREYNKNSLPTHKWQPGDRWCNLVGQQTKSYGVCVVVLVTVEHVVTRSQPKVWRVDDENASWRPGSATWSVRVRTFAGSSCGTWKYCTWPQAAKKQAWFIIFFRK